MHQQQTTQLPEWITFAFGLIVTLAVIALLTYLHFAGEAGPPEIVVTPQVSEVVQSAAGYRLPVSVRNTGGETAEDVVVKVTLRPPQGQAESLTFQIRFLSPQETATTSIVFQRDPREGTLSHVVSFSNP